MKRMLQFFLAGVLAISTAFANGPLSIKPLVERTVDALPEGTLYWRIENFPDAAAATAAAGPWSLVAEAAGNDWTPQVEAAWIAAYGAIVQLMHAEVTARPVAA